MMMMMIRQKIPNLTSEHILPQGFFETFGKAMVFPSIIFNIVGTKPQFGGVRQPALDIVIIIVPFMPDARCTCHVTVKVKCNGCNKRSL